MNISYSAAAISIKMTVNENLSTAIMLFYTLHKDNLNKIKALCEVYCRT